MSSFHSHLVGFCPEASVSQLSHHFNCHQSNWSSSKHLCRYPHRMPPSTTTYIEGVSVYKVKESTARNTRDRTYARVFCFYFFKRVLKWCTMLRKSVFFVLFGCALAFPQQYQQQYQHQQQVSNFEIGTLFSFSAV